MTWCDTCAKKKYDDEDKAQKQVERAKESGVKLTVYRCPLGYGYHLSSHD